MDDGDEAGGRRGLADPIDDALIAATALHHGSTVIIRNVADLARAGVPVLSVWGS